MFFGEEWFGSLVTHIPSGFCALTVSVFEEHDYKLHSYSGENIMDELYNYMNRQEHRIRTIFNQNKSMIELTEDQNISYVMATVCDTCKKESVQSDPRWDITVTLLADISGRSVSHVIYSWNVEHGAISFLFRVSSITAVHMICI